MSIVWINKGLMIWSIPDCRVWVFINTQKDHFSHCIKSKTKDTERKLWYISFKLLEISNSHLEEFISANYSQVSIYWYCYNGVEIYVRIRSFLFLPSYHQKTEKSFKREKILEFYKIVTGLRQFSKFETVFVWNRRSIS